MKNLSFTKGVSALIIVLIIAAVGLLGFVGYRGYEIIRDNTNTSEADKTQPVVADDVPTMESVKEVNSASDIDELNTMLNDINLDDTTDVNLLDSEMASF